jgi:membrane protein
VPSPRPPHARLGALLRDYAQRVWDNSGEDNIFFLAGGIAFNVLLAIVPFFLLLVTGLAYFLNQSAADSSMEVARLLDRLLPPDPRTGSSPAHGFLDEVIRARGSLGIYSAIGFVWFSTRLFGSLRSVLASVFDIEQERGIVEGKLFDIKVTLVSTLLVVLYTAVNFYLATATTRGIAVLRAVGLREELMGGLGYFTGRAVSFALVAVMFFALYRYLPSRRVRPATAVVAALFTGTLFEIFKSGFTAYVASFDPGSLYTGTIAAVVIIVSWVYYACIAFILGGEVGQVYELRRVRRLQREAFED